jgi:hypothetical protein
MAEPEMASEAMPPALKEPAPLSAKTNAIRPKTEAAGEEVMQWSADEGNTDPAAAAPEPTKTADTKRALDKDEAKLAFKADLADKEQQQAIDSRMDRLRFEEKRRQKKGRKSKSARTRIAANKAPPAPPASKPVGGLSYGLADDGAGRAGAPKQAQPYDQLATPFAEAPKEEKSFTARWTVTKHKKLSSAVKKKNCRAAAKLANDILDRDPNYYYKNVSRSSEVKKCSWYVKDETRRRTNARVAAKKARGGGGPSTGKAAPKKAKRKAYEAPAEDATVDAVE